jgi:hypothetical protein
VAKEETVGDAGAANSIEIPTTAGIIISSKTDKIATRAKPSNRDNFCIPFAMANPSYRLRSPFEGWSSPAPE